MPSDFNLKSLTYVCFPEKKELSPSEEWGVDQQLISKLKEQYRKERQKGKRAIQSRLCLLSTPSPLTDLQYLDYIHAGCYSHE